MTEPVSRFLVWVENAMSIFIPQSINSTLNLSQSINTSPPRTNFFLVFISLVVSITVQNFGLYHEPSKDSDNL